MLKAAFYYDGFNLYHAISDLGESYLKWCNLWELAERLIPKQTEELVKVVFCTAFYPGDERKKWRHQQYLNALENVGVTTVKGHYVHEALNCSKCRKAWDRPTEKETDINIALSLVMDAQDDVFDRAYLVTADSDHAATARVFRDRFPQKQLVTVAPPGRNFSVDIARYTGGNRLAITKDHLDWTVFPAIVMSGTRPSGRRPREYDPPDWWVHPRDRAPSA
ncbi:MAG: NYN domain-containing protein [Parvibaculaceae bacterium]